MPDIGEKWQLLLEFVQERKKFNEQLASLRRQAPGHLTAEQQRERTAAQHRLIVLERDIIAMYGSVLEAALGMVEGVGAPWPANASAEGTRFAAKTDTDAEAIVGKLKVVLQAVLKESTVDRCLSCESWLFRKLDSWRYPVYTIHVRQACRNAAWFCLAPLVGVIFAWWLAFRAHGKQQSAALAAAAPALAAQQVPMAASAAVSDPFVAAAAVTVALCAAAFMAVRNVKVMYFDKDIAPRKADVSSLQERLAAVPAPDDPLLIDMPRFRHLASRLKPQLQCTINRATAADLLLEAQLAGPPRRRAAAALLVAGG